MFNRLAASRIIFLLAASSCLISVGLAALEVAQVAATARGLIASLNKTKGQVDLTIKEAQYLILEAGLTANEARKTSANESKMLAIANREIVNTLQDLDAETLQLSKNQQEITAKTADAIDSVRAAAGQALPVLGQTQQDLVQLDSIEHHLDAIASDPNTAKTLVNLQASSAETAATLKDVEESAHAWLHPKWPVKIWHVALDIGRVFNPF